jgi:hypothetical protein
VGKESKGVQRNALSESLTGRVSLFLKIHNNTKKKVYSSDKLWWWRE